jgi:membrane-bound serine protease (ClpP class)
LYIEGLASNWEIIIFIVGLALLGLEIFAFPGFGIAGISGIILIVAGLVLSLVGNINFDFSVVERTELTKAVLTVLGGLTGTMLLCIYISSRIGSKGVFGKLAMQKTLDNNEGFIAVPTEQMNLIGQVGTTLSILRLSGKVMLNGKVYDAISEDGFIEKGVRVKVIRYETGQIYVEKTRN